MQLDFKARELTIKLVYYGPALSGKTTNLQALHEVAEAGVAGRLMTLETKDDRTLFFDLLPLTFRGKGEVSVRLKVFTVPGQVIHASTRRLVLQGADGVVFVADSQLDQTEHNGNSFLDLRNNLKANGHELKDMPLVIQFNKRDLPSIRSEEELRQVASQGREPVYLATATQGVGVTESFLGLLFLTWQKIEQEHALRDKFALDGGELVEQIAAKLGWLHGIERCLDLCLGGSGQFSRLEAS